MKTKILITGSSGFLGCRLAYYFKNKYELLLPAHGELDISREEAVRTYVELHCPEVVVHCAALSNTWYCEQHPEESHRVNVQGVVKLAKACKQTGAKFIFMSSDQVYNGTPMPGPLKEDADLQPVNVYGRHKLEAEQRALWNLPECVGLRLTWMYDLPETTMKLNRNIVVNLLDTFREESTIKAATHEFRGVTYVWEVVKNIEKALSLPGGIYNFGSLGKTDSYMLHLSIAKMLGLDHADKWIQPDEERFSAQTRNLTMDCSLIGRFGIHFNDSLEGLKEALKRPYRVQV